jgi:hypothetical protein
MSRDRKEEVTMNQTPKGNKPDAVTLWTTIGKVATAITTIGVVVKTLMSL